jgi:hypothetical protein
MVTWGEGGGGGGVWGGGCSGKRRGPGPTVPPPQHQQQQQCGTHLVKGVVLARKAAKDVLQAALGVFIHVHGKLAVLVLQVVVHVGVHGQERLPVLLGGAHGAQARQQLQRLVVHALVHHPARKGRSGSGRGLGRLCGSRLLRLCLLLQRLILQLLLLRRPGGKVLVGLVRHSLGVREGERPAHCPTDGG